MNDASSVRAGPQGAGDGGKALLLFQAGPVQEFIAQARSTRDLWSGSYLLSWLMAHAMKAVLDHGGTLVFPATGTQPLVRFLLQEQGPDASVLIPCLPNRFLAEVTSADAARIGRAASDGFDRELGRIAERCWDWFNECGHPLRAEWRMRFDAQIRLLPHTSWQTVPIDEGTAGWRVAHERAETLLAARRNLRDFQRWKTDDQQIGARKDSLSGKEEVVGNGDWWRGLDRVTALQHLFRSDDRLGAPNLVKRVWHRAYLEEIRKLPVMDAVRFESVPDVAAARWRRAGAVPSEQGPPSYVAVIAMDGDRMGEAMSGGGGSGADVRSHLSGMSEALAAFGTSKVRGIVEQHDGQLIYAGGDDVLCMVPAGAALDCAAALRDGFRVHPMLERLDVSAGIAIGHDHAPLQMLVRAAHAAEERAKRELGRAAFSVSLYKRSGEIVEWGAKWESGARELLRRFMDYRQEEAERISAKFTYALEELLQPYLPASAAMKDVKDFPVLEILDAEFDRVLDRQTARACKEDTVRGLRGAYQPYVRNVMATGRHPMRDLLGLFRVATFILRGERE